MAEIDAILERLERLRKRTKDREEKAELGRIETPGGALVQTLPSRSLPSGDASVSWKGRAGRYLLSVTATSDVGAVELTAPFTLRR